MRSSSSLHANQHERVFRLAVFADEPLHDVRNHGITTKTTSQSFSRDFTPSPALPALDTQPEQPAVAAQRFSERALIVRSRADPIGHSVLPRCHLPQAQTQTARGRGSGIGATQGGRRSLGVSLRRDLRTVGKYNSGARMARYGSAAARPVPSVAEDRPTPGSSAPGAALPGGRAGVEVSGLTHTRGRSFYRPRAKTALSHGARPTLQAHHPLAPTKRDEGPSSTRRSL